MPKVNKRPKLRKNDYLLELDSQPMTPPNEYDSNDSDETVDLSSSKTEPVDLTTKSTKSETSQPTTSVKNQTPKSIIIPPKNLKPSNTEQSFLDLIDEEITEIPVYVDGKEIMVLKAAWDEDERTYYVLMVTKYKKLHLDPSQVCEVKLPTIFMIYGNISSQFWADITNLCLETSLSANPS